MINSESSAQPGNYTDRFFESLASGSYASAKEIIPIVIERVNPLRVVDVGCGTGEWLSVCADFGSSDYLGIDGSWIDLNQLRIPSEYFLEWNLTEPIVLNKQFDLVISLEVGEHIPEKYAETFVESLTKLGHAVLFSAAVPKQGGNGHVNERWPEYWAGLFEKRRYVVIDCVRKIVWKNQKVSWWYAQNTFLYLSESVLSRYPVLEKEYRMTNKSQLTLIHPNLFIKKASGHDKYKATLKHRSIVKTIRVINKFPPGLQHRLRPLVNTLERQRKFLLHDVSWP